VAQLPDRPYQVYMANSYINGNLACDFLKLEFRFVRVL